jgi:hypothetical protein
MDKMYFSYAPAHNERFGSGQFQSINRLDGDLYYGTMLAQVCDASGTNSVQRIVIGVLARTDEQRSASKAAESMRTEAMMPIYAVDLSKRGCTASVPGKTIAPP